ncbi:hypothetical protein [Paenibacillus apiarius]|uniref:Tissue inhibitor of metalloproteinase n=1 Tax=Paenibacillus apiarius TaxID=46240 RepID=A0ABT4DQX6_9BACL|nr:hypothetical protein [Paenibacillus apiarius]MCY9514668.1 hypothetical protein [Paenibacillus apiarius]MCY9518658.1 hypothetical protein [Paenibacillus apiarius]MCY9556926.1 hypothetical protein [Paenibacillus apiarius]MCY9686121.1 hypothetical protein [Paenibacillus apiarius]MCY9725321.1 hypothetical protein [Paenibacillus apiarius]
MKRAPTSLPFACIIMMTVVMFGISCLSAAPVSACSCAAIPSVEDAKREAAAVFAGKVTDVSQSLTTMIFSTADPVKVSFQVKRLWKGNVASNAKVVTALSSASCGYEFETGKQYLVYAYHSDGKYIAHLCTRTAPLEAAAEDIRLLGTGRNVNSPYSALLFIGAVAVGIIYLTAIRRKNGNGE